MVPSRPPSFVALNILYLSLCIFSINPSVSLSRNSPWLIRYLHRTKVEKENNALFVVVVVPNVPSTKPAILILALFEWQVEILLILAGRWMKTTLIFITWKHGLSGKVFCWSEMVARLHFIQLTFRNREKDWLLYNNEPPPPPPLPIAIYIVIHRGQRVHQGGDLR